MDWTALLLFAHRGAPTEFPENTIESFRAAKNAGADVLEMDVRTTADGQWVVMHDETVDRTSFASGRVEELTYEFLSTTALRWPSGRCAKAHNDDIEPIIPLLRDVIDSFPEMAMNIDLKAVPLADVRHIVDLIAKHADRTLSSLEPRIRVTSESDVIQREIRRFGGGLVAFGMSRSEVLEVLRSAWLWGRPIDRLRGMAFQAPAYVHVFGLDWPILTRPVRQLLKRMDCPVHLWRDTGMIDTLGEAQAVAAAGADGIFTNQIRTLRTKQQTFQRGHTFKVENE